MTRRFLALLVLLPALLLAPLPVLSQSYFQFDTQDVRIEILSPEKFESAFGGNPDIPRTDAAVLALAQRLYPSLAAKRAMPPPLEVEPQPLHPEFEPGQPRPPPPQPRCGAPQVGALFAALRNPAIANSTRHLVEQIMAESTPALPRTYSSTNFLIKYTDNDPDPKNNVTLSQVKATAALLEKYYAKYVTSFTAPKASLPLKVAIYYIDPKTWGQTASSWNRIELNSEAVRNYCGRRWVSAHELFHRVQYSYGYVSGLPRMDWAVEGSASWAEKFACKSEDIWHYLYDMSDGLNQPDKDLFKSRKYDACHLWVYLEEQARTYLAVKDFWVNYQGNKNPSSALASVIKARWNLGLYPFLQRWHQANILKDLDGISARFDYQEDEVQVKSNCGFTWGLLAHVEPAGTYNLDSSSRNIIGNFVAPGGADYWVFNLDPTMKRVKINFDGTFNGVTGDFYCSFILLKGNIPTIYNTTSNDYTFYYEDLGPGNYDKLIVIVAGRSKGGNYTLSIIPIIYNVNFTANFYNHWESPNLSGMNYLDLSGSASGYIPDLYIEKEWPLSYNKSHASLSWKETFTSVTSICGTLIGTYDYIWNETADSKFDVKLIKDGSNIRGLVAFGVDVTKNIVWPTCNPPYWMGPHTHTINSWTESFNHTPSAEFIIDAAEIGTSFTKQVIFYSGEWNNFPSNYNCGLGTLTFTLVE